MRIINEQQLDFSDVLIRPARSDINSRSEVDIFRTFYKENRQSFSCIPICCANMGNIATINTAKIFVQHGLLCALEKHIKYSDIIDLMRYLSEQEKNDHVGDREYRNRIAVSIGTNEDLSPLLDLHEKVGISIINCDVANGYMNKLQTRVKQLRTLFPNVWIIVGNVVTGDIVTDLLKCGADIIKCGIGPGAQCLTRKQTGVGRPMVSMLEDCSDAAHQIHGYIMSDGGCTCPGDICKALGLADFVMVGSLFASAEESDGETVTIDNIKYKKFAGMSSAYAQNKYFGGFKSNYRSSEGRQSLVKISGSLHDIINDILGGLRSCFAYCGCHKMKHWQKHCVFYKVNHQLTTTFENAKTFDN